MQPHLAREIAEHISNDVLTVLVKPNANTTEVLGWDPERQALRISIAAPARENKANIMLVRILKKLTGRQCHILTGATSHRKVVRFS